MWEGSTPAAPEISRSPTSKLGDAPPTNGLPSHQGFSTPPPKGPPGGGGGSEPSELLRLPKRPLPGKMPTPSPSLFATGRPPLLGTLRRSLLVLYAAFALCSSLPCRGSRCSFVNLLGGSSVPPQHANSLMLNGLLFYP